MEQRRTNELLQKILEKELTANATHVTENYVNETISEPLVTVVTTSDRLVTKVDRAVKMLKDNPSWKDLPTRELENLTDIDRNTWSKAKGRS
ncbi:MAG: hypothetical protein ABI947_14940 [Chloroflexota bacterium]